jgi:hypothetical protein
MEDDPKVKLDQATEMRGLLLEAASVLSKDMRALQKTLNPQKATLRESIYAALKASPIPMSAIQIQRQMGHHAPLGPTIIRMLRNGEIVRTARGFYTLPVSDDKQAG